jgi:hypothetical protein
MLRGARCVFRLDSLPVRDLTDAIQGADKKALVSEKSEDKGSQTARCVESGTDGPSLRRASVASMQSSTRSNNPTPVEAQPTVIVDDLVVEVIPPAVREFSRSCTTRCEHNGSTYCWKPIRPDAVKSGSPIATYAYNLQAFEKPLLRNPCVAGIVLDWCTWSGRRTTDVQARSLYASPAISHKYRCIRRGS